MDRGDLDEATELVMAGKERFDLAKKGSISVAGLREVIGPTLRR